VDARRLAELLAELLHRTGPAAPLLLFLAAFIEYVFPPFPGDLLVVLGAWYATHGELSWPVTFVAVTLGAVLGAAVDWRVGRWLGARIGERAAAGRLDRERVLRFEAAYRRWGGLLLVANRFLPGVRAFFFVAAGASGIPLWEVLLFGGLSAALWNGLLLAAGAYAARNLEELVGLVERYNTAALALLGVAVLVAALWWWRSRRAKR
jgi:membrane-associated protein